MEVEFYKSPKPDKRLMAIFTNNRRTRTLHFGSNTNNTYIDHKNKKIKRNRIARHKVRENWDAPMTSGALSRWILWGPSTNIHDNIEYFKNKFSFD